MTVAHSITSSARASSVGGTSRPSALGGLEVDHQLVLGRLHDRQVRRLGAFENSGRIHPDFAIGLRDAGSVAGKAARYGELANIADRGHRVASRESRHLTSQAAQGRIGGHHEPRKTARTQTREQHLDVAFVAGRQDLKVQPERPRCFARVLDFGLGLGIAGVGEKADRARARSEFAQQLQPLRDQCAVEKDDAREIAAWPVQAFDDSKLHRIAPARKDNRDGRCRSLCREG